MRRYVVLGVNENPKYFYFLPLVYWAWEKIGWDVILFISGSYHKAMNLVAETTKWAPCGVGLIGDYKSETIAQVSRLYGACVTDGLLMTSDVDMLPLSDYWHPKPGEFTTYGRDLTDYHYPICYLAAMDYDWREIMVISKKDYQQEISKSLRHQKNMWTLDQDIITERLFVYQDQLTRIDRGTDPRTGYPLGRVDRSNWRLDHKQLIDCHLPHDILTNDASFRKVMELLHLVWPDIDFKWFATYHKEFKKLI